ncbi:hypothetical protein N0V90_009292 [Kalmusia sp. IMI 367209]|nr:hypothetical protein N0V90_009292 [Kalmusia sp. IMI 367209]
MTGYYTRASGLGTTMRLTDLDKGGFALDTGLQGVIAQLNSSMGGTSSNEYCPGTGCEFPFFTSLASCSQCFSQDHHFEDFDCEGDFFWQNSTQTFFDSYLKLKRNIGSYLEEIPYYMSMMCVRKLDGYPALGVNMTVFFNSTRDSTGKRIPTIEQVELRPSREAGTYMGGNQYSYRGTKLFSTLRACTPFDNPDLEFFGPPRYSSWTCFKSTTNASLYSSDDGRINMESFGQINGSVTTCGLELCALPWQTKTQAYGQGLPLVLENGNSKPSSFNDNDTLSFMIPDFIPFTYSGKNYTSRQPFDKTAAERGPFNVREIVFMRLATSLRSLASHSVGEMAYFNDTDIDFEQLFTDFASVVSHYIQSDWNPDRINVTGTVYATAVFADVRFAWFVAPLLIIFMSMVFFTTTVSRDRNRSYLFKTSLLPVLLHGLEYESVGLDGTSKVERDKETYEVLMRAAEKIRVRLEKNEEGVLKLKRQ